MANNYILSCCSTCDLSLNKIKELELEYIPFHFYLDNKEYLDNFGSSLSYDDFYSALDKGVSTKTSQVTVNEYLEYFDKFLSLGKDILHVSFSSGLSGSYNSAMIAKNQLAEKYPGRKIYIVDSLCASSGYGLLMQILSTKKKEGMDIEQLNSYAENIKLNIQHWFFSTDLKYYIRGGRVSKVSGFIGTLLHICPVLNVNDEGKLIPREKILSATIAIQQVAKKVELFKEPDIKEDFPIFISHSNCNKFAQNIKNTLISKYKKKEENIEIFPVGTTIGSHTGPGTLALFFVGKKRTA